MAKRKNYNKKRKDENKKEKNLFYKEYQKIADCKDYCGEDDSLDLIFDEAKSECKKNRSRKKGKNRDFSYRQKQAIKKEKKRIKIATAREKNGMKKRAPKNDKLKTSLIVITYDEEDDIINLLMKVIVKHNNATKKAKHKNIKYKERKNRQQTREYCRKYIKEYA